MKSENQQHPLQRWASKTKVATNLATRSQQPAKNQQQLGRISREEAKGERSRPRENEL
jgi:hypothetical protein